MEKAKSKSRAVDRVVTAFKNHPQRSTLRLEEAMVL